MVKINYVNFFPGKKANSFLKDFSINQKNGLNEKVIHRMSLHKDLPAIVAFNTFLGLTGSSGNILFNQSTNQFCGIDLESTFKRNFVTLACQRIQKFIQNKKKFVSIELNALQTYRHTLQRIIHRFSVQNILLLFD